MRSKTQYLSIVVILFLVALACNAPGAAAPTGNQETAIAQKVIMDITLTAIGNLASQLTTTLSPTIQQTPTQTITNQSTYTPLPTYTALPTYTNQPPPSNQPPPTPIPTPCNWATFVGDITYPDGSAVTVGTGFVKTWRLKNIGTCTWTSGYSLIFDHGDRMGASDAVTLTGSTVPPGGTVDASVSLTAPGAEGTYQGFFRLKAPDGSIFGIGASANGSFWSKIQAVSAAPPPPVGQPELDITAYSVTPNSIVEGHSVDVQISIKNKGAVNAGPFEVWWWSGEPTIAPQKIWNVPNLVAGGTIMLNYSYNGYKVKLAPGWDSYVVADAGNDVVESNEGNNTAHQNEIVLFNLIFPPLLPPVVIPGP